MSTSRVVLVVKLLRFFTVPDKKIIVFFLSHLISDALHVEVGELDTSPKTEYPAVMHKKWQMYVATKTNREGLKLQGPNSDVEVEVLQAIQGTLVGHVQLNPEAFLKHIPETECLIAAIPDYNFYPQHNRKESSGKPRFKITLKHTIENPDDLKYIQVRHGNIYTGTNFEIIPHTDNNPEGRDIYWEADINNIAITTTHFSQFLCTSCKVICDTRLVAFVTGAVRKINSCRIADIVLFMCPLQFTTEDYKKVYTFFCP